MDGHARCPQEQPAACLNRRGSGQTPQGPACLTPVRAIHRKALLGAPGAMMSPVWCTTSCADLARARVLATKCWYLHATACAVCHCECLYACCRHANAGIARRTAAAAVCLPQATCTALTHAVTRIALGTTVHPACLPASKCTPIDQDQDDTPAMPSHQSTHLAWPR